MGAGGRGGLLLPRPYGFHRRKVRSRGGGRFSLAGLLLGQETASSLQGWEVRCAVGVGAGLPSQASRSHSARGSRW